MSVHAGNTELECQRFDSYDLMLTSHRRSRQLTENVNIPPELETKSKAGGPTGGNTGIAVILLETGSEPPVR